MVLEEARKTREEVRDKLTAASLARLTAPETTAQAEPAKGGTGFASDTAHSEDNFPTHAAFALEALPALTTRPDQIKTLRQTILNLAVRGKLVEQEPADESGQELLERMRQRADLLRKDAGVRKKKRVAPLDGIDDMGLPDKWSAEAFANIIDPRATISYGVLVPGPDVEDGIPFVRAQDLMLSGHPDKPGKVIAYDIECKYTRTRLEGGEILLCVVGSIGKLGIAPTKWAGANIARAVARIAPMEEISREFTLLFLRSDLAQTYFNEATRTLAQPTLNVGLIEKLTFPIPPLAEQHRIVAKVDALMTRCDRLEAALTTTDNTRTRLLEALLYEALDPAAE
ncbi:restriction endonuclease subunit S [Tritonibacter mobilis]|uniref:restriction endonuclease subunit S n=1 Tax=Tritonibacter mobilis TaxID=379347 RepID=UPI000806BB10|nr:restriction endonuclease subunit S [Tritonibacter mobilis]